MAFASPLTQGRGLKCGAVMMTFTAGVAPYAGAWIEIKANGYKKDEIESPLTQGRGLK